MAGLLFYSNLIPSYSVVNIMCSINYVRYVALLLDQWVSDR